MKQESTRRKPTQERSRALCAAIEDAARTQPGPDATAGDGPDDVMPPTGGGVDGRDTPQAAAPAGAAGRSDAAAQAGSVKNFVGRAKDWFLGNF